MTFLLSTIHVKRLGTYRGQRTPARLSKALPPPLTRTNRVFSSCSPCSRQKVRLPSCFPLGISCPEQPEHDDEYENPQHQHPSSPVRRANARQAISSIHG